MLIVSGKPKAFVKYVLYMDKNSSEYFFIMVKQPCFFFDSKRKGQMAHYDVANISKF